MQEPPPTDHPSETSKSADERVPQSSSRDNLIANATGFLPHKYAEVVTDIIRLADNDDEEARKADYLVLQGKYWSLLTDVRVEFQCN